ncbi:hypothetical protein ACN6K9_003491 [Streptomyces sp. SAS_267]|uniref:hypothetical protein n=1 Tax=Streptomyces sp. SAS_267 TaxID=3412750 RepID=UPI00403CBCFD
MADAKGQVVGFEAAEGRERIPVRVQRIDDHTLVVPSDAQRLIPTGKLDVAELTDPLLRASQDDGLKLIVQYEGGAGTARAEVRSAGDTRLRRTFPTLDADAIRTPQDDVATVWEALTDQRKSGVRATASAIIAGMEWAADEGADVVNLSLGGPDSPGVDPLEAEVDKLSAENRDGVKVGENADPLSGAKPFTVESTDAEYRLTTSVERSEKVAAASTRIDAGFTFRSRQVAATTALPVSTVRFAAPVDLASRAPADASATIPVTVQGSAAGKNLKSLIVSVSYDDGTTWQLVKVESGRISVRNPAKEKGISFLAEITDKQGNKSTLTIHNAYYGK